MPTKTIDLRIEKVVLHGFKRADQQLIGFALERELTRLLGEQGLSEKLSNGAIIAALNNESFQLTPGTQADVIGIRIAQSIHRQMSD